MSRFTLCNCPAGFSAAPERHATDCPGRSGAGKPSVFLGNPCSTEIGKISAELVGACQPNTEATQISKLQRDLLAAISQLAALREELATAERGLANCKLALDAQTHNFDKSQQRLADVERRNASYESAMRELLNDEDGLLAAAEISTGFVWCGLQKHAKAISAALNKPEPVQGLQQRRVHRSVNTGRQVNEQ